MGGRILWGLIGAISIIGGVVALINPFGASLAATVLAAWMFIIVGVLEIFGAFQEEGAGRKIWMILLGILAIWVGIAIRGNPLAGMATLTTVVAISFFVVGVFKIVLSFSVENRSAYWLILLSGIVSVVLGIMILANFPMSAASVLGILLGIELISNGVTMLALAMASPPSDQAT